MKWLVTVLILVNLGNSRGNIINNRIIQYLEEKVNDIISLFTPLPEDVTNVVAFYLYTREEPSKGQEIILHDVNILESSFFNPENNTKVIIHGFMDDSEGPMASGIKDKILEQEESNVILVDWGKIAKEVYYEEIAKKTGDVGAYVAQLVNFLVDNGANLDNFHIIGHSLGAHVAGFAGAGVANGTVSRITGLDPAMPGFNNVSAEKRLDRSNANFVDCIHTCAGTLGLKEAICTADFYPNGGKNRQPGCPFYDFGQCSHDRSYGYFIESIDPDYKFPAEECDSVPTNSINPPSCEPSQVTMGYYTDPNISGIYFTTTNKKEPYAPIHP